jgi:hypothetical protein
MAQSVPSNLTISSFSPVRTGVRVARLTADHDSQYSTLLSGSSMNSGLIDSVALDTAMALGVSH